MNHQRLRLLRATLTLVVGLCLIRCVRAANVGAVLDTNTLATDVNPAGNNRSYFTVGDNGIIDGSAAIWSWNGLITPDGTTNMIGSIFSTGAWVRSLYASTKTNLANVNITNLFVISNLVVEGSTYITTNIFIVNGDTNRLGLWTDFSTFIAPTSFTNFFQISYNGGLCLGTNCQLSFDPDGRLIQLDTTEADNGGLLLRMTTDSTALEPSKPSPPLTLRGNVWDSTFSEEHQVEFRLSVEGEDLGNAAYSGGLLTLTFANPYVVTNAPIFQFGSEGQLIFGPGTTNVLYRSGSELVYTNGAVDPKFQVLNGGGGGVELEAQNQTGFLTAVSPSTTVGLRAGASQVVLFSGLLEPVVDLHESLGGLANSWNEAYMSNLFVRGTFSAPNNFVRMNAYMSNGVAIFDIQNNGTGPAPIGFSFNTNGIEVGHFP